MPFRYRLRNLGLAALAVLGLIGGAEYWGSARAPMALFQPAPAGKPFVAAPAATASVNICNDAHTAGTALYVKPSASGDQSGSNWTNAMALPANPVRGKVYCIADGSYGGYGPTYPAVSDATQVTFKKATVTDHGTATGWSDTLGDGTADFSEFWLNSGTPSYTTVNGYSEVVTGNHGIRIVYGGESIGINLKGSLNTVTLSYMECVGPAAGGPDFWCVNGGYFSPDTGKVNITYSHIKSTGGSTCYRIRNGTNFIGEYLECYDYDTSSGGDHANALYTESCTNCTLRYSNFDVTTEGMFITCPEGTCSPASWPHSWSVYGNVFTNGRAGSNARGIETPSAWTSAPGPINLYNNTFAGFSEQGALVMQGDVSADSVAYNNLFYNCTASGGSGISAWTTHDYSWAYASGTITEAHVQNGSGDPFVNYAGRDFRLSAQTNAGYTLASPYHLDPLGVTRGQGVWDRGAYEKVP